MKKYLSFFRIRFNNGLQYRAAALAGIATQFVWGFMEIILYTALYRSNPDAAPMTYSELSSYIWMRQAFLALFNSWAFDGEIFEMITSGGVAYELCRPCGIYGMWYAKNAATRVSRAALRCLPILLVAWFLPENMRMNPPADLLSAGLFMLSMAAGFLVTIAFSMLVYISAFYTLSATGIRIIAVNIIGFFSGELIPIPFMPNALRRALELLPFSSMQSAPFLIYSGYYRGKEAVTMLGLQLFWLVVLYAIGRLWMSRALGRVIIQGG